MLPFNVPSLKHPENFENFRDKLGINSRSKRALAQNKLAQGARINLLTLCVRKLSAH